MDKSLKIKEEEYKKLEDYHNKTKVPYWKIIKDIIEGKIKLEVKHGTKSNRN